MPLAPPSVFNDLADTADFAALSPPDTEIFALLKVIVSKPLRLADPVLPVVV